MVDNEKYLRLLAKSAMEKSGFAVVAAENGKEALSVFQRTSPDIVLLDKSMPIMDGIATCAHLREMPGGALQGALVALDPQDGSLLAMVGGRDYGRSQFNRVSQARRQPGSMFKPFVYLAGFRQSQLAGDASFTAATVLEDSPLEMKVGGKQWTPGNTDGLFRGPVGAREALALSLNVPTIRAAEMIGLNEVVRTARRCGIESRLQPVPSLALGTFEVTPLGRFFVRNVAMCFDRYLRERRPTGPTFSQTV